MSELETLQALERETGLLASAGDVEHMRQTSYQFTVKAASRLRREGWALLKAPPGGNQINGVRIDKIINRTSLQMVDIIVNADDPNSGPRRAAWQPVGTGSPGDVVEAPADTPTTEPPPPSPPSDDDSPLAIVAARLVEVSVDLIAANDRLGAVITHLLEQVAIMQRDGVKVRLR